MAVKHLIALTLFLTTPWLPVFKLSNSVDAVQLLEDDPKLKVQKEHEDLPHQCRNGKSISFNYSVTIICILTGLFSII